MSSRATRHVEWPRRTAPIPGELLSSCLARNAFAHGATPSRFLALFWRGNPLLDRNFDRDPAGLLRPGRRSSGSDLVNDMAAHLHVPRRTVEEATLAGWCAALAGPSLAGAGDTPLLLSTGLRQSGRTLHALQFCPACLGEGTPHFRKVWRLGFVVACKRHGRPLLDACAACGAAVIPHRSLTGSVAGCHACGLPLTRPGRGGAANRAPDAALAMQAWLSRALFEGEAATEGLWRGREAFDVARTLIAVSAPASVHARLRGAFGLGGLPATDNRMRFEQTRLAIRIPWLETVHVWMADWPRGFRNGADAAGLTRQSFVRCRLPPALAHEVARLPVGIRRDHSWKPVLDEPVLRRLRRTNPTEYRRVRAERILLATGFKA